MARSPADSPVNALIPDDLPAGAAGLEMLRDLARGCTGCDLYRDATQTVFGEGDPTAEVVLVGEQPGDKEDLAGHPFVGPSGALLDQSLAAAGIDRSRTYVTNAVKHFKWERKGKVRLHKTPNRGEQLACRPWLDAELDALRPKVVVALGATAAKALLGADFKVTQHRGELLSWDREPLVTATVHPSAVLRSRDRRRDEELFVADLRVAAAALGSR